MYNVHLNVVFCVFPLTFVQSQQTKCDQGISFLCQLNTIPFIAVFLRRMMFNCLHKFKHRFELLLYSSFSSSLEFTSSFQHNVNPFEKFHLHFILKTHTSPHIPHLTETHAPLSPAGMSAHARVYLVPRMLSAFEFQFVSVRRGQSKI